MLSKNGIRIGGNNKYNSKIRTDANYERNDNMNKIIIKGNLAKDVEFVKENKKKDKQAFAKFSVAVNRSYAKDKCDFFFCTAFGKTAEFLDEYFEKGSPVLVCGRMESYKNDDDVTCWSLVVESVEFAGSKNSKD